MLSLTPQTSYLVLFLVTLPISAWVIFTDLKYMKIRNYAVLAMLVVFALVGVLVIPFEFWIWRWSHFALILVAGIVLNAVAHFGAGDAKYAAAAAPFVSASPASLNLIVLLLFAFILSAFATHRLMRRVPAVRRMAPDWVSWDRKDFPLGVALAGTLSTYLLLQALH